VRKLIEELTEEWEDETTHRLLRPFTCSVCHEKRPFFERSSKDDAICKYCSGEYVDFCKDCKGEDCGCCEHRESSKRRRCSR